MRRVGWLVSAVLLVLAVSASLLTQASPAQALTGGPDAGGYTFTDSNEAGGPTYNFEDISDTGTSAGDAATCDDCVSPALPIGFTFNYYGTDYTSAYVSSNGFLTFLAG
jgi:hypothetical protein